MAPPASIFLKSAARMLFISLRPAYVRISHVFFFTVSVWVFCEPFCFKSAAPAVKTL